MTVKLLGLSTKRRRNSLCSSSRLWLLRRQRAEALSLVQICHFLTTTTSTSSRVTIVSGSLSRRAISKIIVKFRDNSPIKITKTGKGLVEVAAEVGRTNIEVTKEPSTRSETRETISDTPTLSSMTKSDSFKI